MAYLIGARYAYLLTVVAAVALLWVIVRYLQARPARVVQLRQVMDLIPGHVIVMTPSGEAELVNRQVLDYLGRTFRELQDCGRSGHIHPDDRPRVRAAWERAVDTREPFDVELRLRRADGVYRWFHARHVPERDALGNVIRWYLLQTDIEEQKRAEEARQRSAETLRRVIDTLPAMAWSATPDGAPEYLSQRLVNYAGRGPVDPADLKWVRKLMHPSDVFRVDRAWIRAVKTEAPLDVTRRIRGADGSYRWFHTRAAPLRDAAGRVVQWYGLDVDIDDRVKAEDALRAAQAQLSRAAEIATVSELAASIAHEINQPLGALVANAHASQRWLGADPPNVERARLVAEKIIRDGHAASEVVTRIRALFKRSDLPKTPLDVNEIIAEVTRLMRREAAARDVRIDTKLDATLPRVWADRIEMQQVLVNLTRNGIEAMDGPNGHARVLAIRSERDEANGVLIEVRDSGNGLTDVEKVFEPFFTTKDQGLGLGLAISRRIVEAHGGRLWATNNDSRGATFRLTLPTQPNGS